MTRTGICSWLIPSDSGNSIHAWRILRKRISVGAGLLTALLVAIYLAKNPSNPGAIVAGAVIWMLFYDLLHSRRYAAQLANSQRKLFGKYGLTDRREIASNTALMYALLVISAPFVLLGFKFGNIKPIFEIIWMVVLLVVGMVWSFLRIKSKQSETKIKK